MLGRIRDKDVKLSSSISEEEKKAFQIASIKGSIDLETSNLSSDEVEIISYGEKAKILNDGTFYFESFRNNNNNNNTPEEFLVLKKGSNKVIYYTLSDGSKLTSKKKLKKNNSEKLKLNAEETSLTLIIKNLPFSSGFSKQQIRELKKTIKDVAPHELNDLTKAIEKEISNPNNLWTFKNDEIYIRAGNIVKNYFFQDYIFSNDDTIEQEDIKDDSKIKKILPQFKSANPFGQARVEEGEFNQDTKNWDLNCSIYNALPIYMIVTEANIYNDPISGKLIQKFDKTKLTHVINPFNTSKFYKSFTTIDGVKNFYSEFKQRFEGKNWTGFIEDPSHTTNKNSDIELKFSKDHNSLLFISPNQSVRVMIINLISQVAAVSELLLTDHSEKKLLKDKKKSLRNKVIKELITNKELLNQFTLLTTSSSKKNFSKFTTIVFDALIEQISKEIYLVEDIIKIKKGIDIPVDVILKKTIPQMKVAIDFTKTALDAITFNIHRKKNLNHRTYITKPQIKQLIPDSDSQNVSIDDIFSISFYTPMTEHEVPSKKNVIKIFEENKVIDEINANNYQWSNNNTTLLFKSSKLEHGKSYRIIIEDNVLKGKFDFLGFNELSFLKEKTKWIFRTKTEKIYNGDVILTTQQEIDSFGLNNYTIINGSLTIGKHPNYLIKQNIDINNLTKLKSLTKVKGDFNLLGLNNLKDLEGLNNLNYVNNNFNMIGGNNIPSDWVCSTGKCVENFGLISNIQSLENLTHIGGKIEVSFYPITNFCPFEKLLIDNSNFTIENNTYNPTLSDLENGNCKN